MEQQNVNLGDHAWFIQRPTITELIDAAITSHIDHPNPDAVLNIETHMFNTQLHAWSCEYDLDVGKQLWLNRQRWSRLITEYLSHDSWSRFRDQAVEIFTRQARVGATANMFFRDPDRYAKKHRWGGCLMGATFRGDNYKAGPATITFYSRTTYISYMGLLDIGIASVMAKEIGEAVGLNEKAIEFRWFISSQQFHAFKSLPFIYSHPVLMKRLEKYERNRALAEKDKISPTWYYVCKWYFKVVDQWRAFHEENVSTSSMPMAPEQNEAAEAWLMTEKYGPFRRIKRRWLEHKGILTKLPPPSLKLSTLDFSKAMTDGSYMPDQETIGDDDTEMD